MQCPKILYLQVKTVSIEKNNNSYIAKIYQHFCKLTKVLKSLTCRFLRQFARYFLTSESDPGRNFNDRWVRCLNGLVSTTWRVATPWSKPLPTTNWSRNLYAKHKYKQRLNTVKQQPFRYQVNWEKFKSKNSTLSLLWRTKTEFLPSISIQYQVDKWWE